MGDSCCSGEAAQEQAVAPPRLWQVRKLQLAAAAGLLLLLAWPVGRAGSDGARLALECGALTAGGATFVPAAVRGLLARRLGVDTLMMLAAVGAVLLGQVWEAAALAFLYSISEGLEGWSLARTATGFARCSRWSRTGRRCCAPAARSRWSRPRWSPGICCW
jgi:cation-transporting ATPase G